MGRIYRLPTEAEWEYTCRAGSTTRFSFGNDDKELGNYGWYVKNSEQVTHPVKQKLPNAWGFYDMHGNVREMCFDWYGDLSRVAESDPIGKSTGIYRVDRGGGFNFEFSGCESANRIKYLPNYRDFNVGFRVALSLPETSKSKTRIELATEVVKPSSNFISRLPQITNSIGMEMNLVPVGTFNMGNQGDSHPVILTKPFFLGVAEVTQKEYQQVMGLNPSKFVGSQNPVERVTWVDAIEFCRKLSVMSEEKAAGRVYRLPTEAEWEYACRSGTTTRWSFGNVETDLHDYAFNSGNSGGQTHAVKQKNPNAWGFYDMHGNVSEWCSDRHGDYPKGMVSDPVGPSEGFIRVVRGGSLFDDAVRCVSAFRFPNRPTFRNQCIGFRVAFGLPETPSPKTRIELGTEVVKPSSSFISRLPQISNSIGMEMNLVSGGTLSMDGSDSGQIVTLTNPYYLGVTEITQDQYQRVMGVNPSKFKGTHNPVDSVSWQAAVGFCLKLSALPGEKNAGRIYRLPTEAEWEFACRAGSTAQFSFGEDENQLGNYGWYGSNSRLKTHPVKQKKPNAWGFYDMHGNVWELVSDRHDRFTNSDLLNPSGPSVGSHRVGRGGSFYDKAMICAFESRGRFLPTARFDSTGFRVAMTLTGTPK